MSKRYIKKFETFQFVKRIFDKVDEAVVQFDDKYKVGGIEVKQSTINAYVKKTREETGKNLRSLYSESEIAELLVQYVVSNKLEVDQIPASALLGGDASMENDIDMDAEASTEVGDQGMEGEQPVAEPAAKAGDDSVVAETPDTASTIVAETPDTASETEETPPADEEKTPGSEEFGEPTSNEEENEEEGEKEGEEEKEEEPEEEKGEENEELPL